MTVDPKPIAAFVEYVVRPMLEDWRTILEKSETLKFPLPPELIRDVAKWMALTHVALEVLRLLAYVGITWLVCQTVRAVW